MSDNPQPGTGSEPGANPPTPPAPPAPPAEPKFTQADLDKITGTARGEGRTAAMKELLAELGVTDVEAAKALVSSAKEAEDAQKTEAQKLAEENARLKAEAVQATQLATQAVAGTALREGLRDAGINPERISAAIRLVDLATVQVNGADVTGVTEAVESVKASSPEWFGPQAGAPDATGGTGGGTGTDYRTSSRDELRDAAAKYGIAL